MQPPHGSRERSAMTVKTMRTIARPGLLAWSAWWLVVTSGVAQAAPLATLSEDIDGDGAPDAIELGADGVVHIAGKPRGEVKLAAALTAGRLAGPPHPRQPHHVPPNTAGGPPGDAPRPPPRGAAPGRGGGLLS